MWKKAVLVCNGSIDTKHLHAHIGKNDFLIAVDGGANKLVKTHFQPAVIIGDMDSITKSAGKKFRHAQFIRFPREKDKVDLELALDYCAEKKFREILILGALGSRADMTLTNFFLLTRIPQKIRARIIHENQEIYLAPKKSIISGVPGEKISFFPIRGDVGGLTLEGFKYGVKNQALVFGTGRGLSNEFKGKKAKITFKSGILLCVHFRAVF
ncbi:MAG: thiamine diphosphokinase [Candidatus Diapherotrites archaeon]|nr:thiamine diphosphokinase [Candidatus Diapherotrites archaeon]